MEVYLHGYSLFFRWRVLFGFSVCKNHVFVGVLAGSILLSTFHCDLVMKWCQRILLTAAHRSLMSLPRWVLTMLGRMLTKTTGWLPWVGWRKGMCVSAGLITKGRLTVHSYSDMDYESFHSCVEQLPVSYRMSIRVRTPHLNNPTLLSAESGFVH